jgi:outer membrane protein OmpA-like peptidoglycan-associated protein
MRHDNGWPARCRVDDAIVTTPRSPCGPDTPHLEIATIMRSVRPTLVLIVAVALVTVACTANDEHRRTKIGAAVGAVAGAVIGNQGDDDSDRYVGAAVGGLAGAAVGNYMDRQRRALKARLSPEQRRNLDITEVGNNALKIGIASDATFAFDSADIEPRFRSTYDDIADVLQEFDKTVVHVIGHTDSVGEGSYNIDLSKRRSRSVGLYLRERGVQGDRLVYEGRGERQPIATNETEAGRRQNRRVAIVIKPVVQGKEQAAYEPPRKP